MGLYRYRAVTPEGEVLDGLLDATAAGDVVLHLQADGLMPLSIRRSNRRARVLRWPHRSGPGHAQTEHFTRELATLLEVGVPLDHALQILGRVTGDAALRRLSARIGERLRAGDALSAALSAEGRTFSPLYLALVRAGEASGHLDRALAQTAQYLERSRELRNALVSALVYPTILLVVAALSVVVLMLYVVPELARVFAGMDAALPFSTRMVIATAEFMRSYGWLAPIALLVLALLAQRLLADGTRRQRLDHLLLGLPLAGALIARTETARLARTLAALLEAGVSLPLALGIARDVLSNRCLSAAVDAARQALEEGRGFARPLADSAAFPPMAMEMLRVGEEAGRLDTMLGRVASVYEAEVQAALRRALAVLEPLLIVGLGVLVVGIVFSLLAAVIGLNELVM